MISYLFNILLFDPLYNALVFITEIIPGHNVAIAIIVLTIIVKLLLFPLYHKSTLAQTKIKELEPSLKKIKEKYSDNKQEQAKLTMELYREHGINTLTSFALLFIQLPIVLALFWVFSRGFELNLDILYPFIEAPQYIDLYFLGLIKITEHSIPLAILVGLTQFIQMQLAIPPLPKTKIDKPTFKDDFARSLNIQMKYIMPIIIVFIASSLSAAISIYWFTGNLFAIGHELFVKRKAFQLRKSL